MAVSTAIVATKAAQWVPQINTAGRPLAIQALMLYVSEKKRSASDESVTSPFLYRADRANTDENL